MPADQGGCGSIGKMIVMVIAVAVTFVLAGPMFLALVETLGPEAAAVVSTAASAAVGSVAGQAVSIAAGMQDSFSWRGVATAALTAGVAAGIGGSGLIGGNTWQAAAGNAMLSNVVSQGIGIVTGLQHGFNWRSMAAAGSDGAVGDWTKMESTGAFDKLLKDTASKFAGGAASSVLRGGRVSMTQIATDAFGNALGDSLAESMSPTPGALTKSFQHDVEVRKNSVPEWARPVQSGSGQDYMGAYSEAALAPDASSAPASTSSAASTSSTKSKVNDIGLTDNQVLLGKASPSGWFDSTIDSANKTISVNINVKYDTSTLTGTQGTRLMSLTQDGVSQFWSRSIDLNGDTYAVNVNVSEDEKGMPIRLKIDSGKEYVRSFNTNGASFPFSAPGATINYQQGFSGGNMDWADKDYQLVSAHEIGHPILTLAGGREYSWSHEGTSGTFGGDNGTLAPVPKTGEMNLMKYYEDATVNMKYARSIASESDVKNLIYISKRR